MTKTAASFDKLAKITPITMMATKTHGQEDPGSALFGGGSVMV